MPRHALESHRQTECSHRPGWQRDPGSTDPDAKCCRSAPAACDWFQTKAACAAALSHTTCLPCTIGENNLGCPSWGMPPVPPPPPPLVVTGVSFTDLTLEGGSSGATTIPSSALGCMNTKGTFATNSQVFIPENRYFLLDKPRSPPRQLGR